MKCKSSKHSGSMTGRRLRTLRASSATAKKVAQKLKGMGTIGAGEREALEARALTCGMISMIDDAIGRVREAGQANSAVTIFTSDHGDHLGDRQLLFKGAEQYEQITWVPFICSDPARPRNAQHGRHRPNPRYWRDYPRTSDDRACDWNARPIVVEWRAKERIHPIRSSENKPGSGNRPKGPHNTFRRPQAFPVRRRRMGRALRYRERSRRVPQPME